MHLPLVLTFVFFSLQTWCQTVQDDWTAPAAPDGSTPLQSGTKFTLLWKPALQNNFATYCPLCDTAKLDLWITNFNGTKYTSKIGRGIDLFTATSYDWNVNIASTAFSENAFWVFRFTFFDSVDPYSQQISSPGFKISGLVKASSTTVAQSSSSTSDVPASSSFAATFTSAVPSNSMSSTTTPSEPTSTPDTTSRSNTWIAGVVAGPIVGIALGAALMWYCLRRRKEDNAQQIQGNTKRNQRGCNSQYTSTENAKNMYSQTIASARHPWQQEVHSQYVAEAPAHSIPAPPAELWQGNYRS
ncbi:uncharacterized protein M421DRAFT_416596 [Didymella exigua CBS 183.55]|uniref:Mid2 domain-containing protein n=1 Tax=Didymella exigua CBS 183.55 TaxID=1150837 RepID=A0A6A5S135_9PLEO|nr:uncharacterized protein M421DRAFT_416596 [Didymella exigua CBS 183.55]KAF1932998.1 hypothetical protein M421DRAFT_416596 [Didymella exigua CBS 183.55]